MVSSKPGITNCRNLCSLFIQVAFIKLILLPCREKHGSDQIVISGLHVIPGVFNSKQTSFLAQTNTTEIACLLLVANQWQNVNKIHPSRGKSKTLQSHPCTLPTLTSHLSSGSSWGQLLWWSVQRSKLGGRCYLESGFEELRQYLSEHFMANTLNVSSGINPVLLCMSPQYPPLHTSPLP